MMKIIVDCDTGNDDAFAIYSLLKAEHKFDYKVVAITCVDGNTSVENSTLNTLMVLETCSRMDIPVYKGSESSLIMKNENSELFHGKDGLSDVYDADKKPCKSLVQKKHATEALRDYIEEHSNDISILAIGPLTNIALLYKLNPGISSKIKSLHIMGGNHQGVGNITKHAEFNFWSDPEAAHIVFAESKCPIYVFPWEPCIQLSCSLPFHDFRMKVLSNSSNPFTKFIDPVEKIAYEKFELNWMPCDLFLATCFIIPQIIRKIEEHHVTIELSGVHTRGMMVIDHLKTAKPNAHVIKEMDVEMFKNFIMWVCDHDVEFL